MWTFANIGLSLRIFVLLFVDDVFRAFSNPFRLLTLPLAFLLGLPVLLAMSGRPEQHQFVATFVRQRGEAMPGFVRKRLVAILERPRA